MREETKALLVQIGFFSAAIFFIYLMWIFIVPMTRSIINAGNIAGLAFSSVFAFACIAHKAVWNFLCHLWGFKAGRFLIILFFALFIIITATFSILSFFMIKASNNPPLSPAPVVVLGCKLNGSTPSEMLTRRLEAAEEYLKSNPSVSCVVSGGQGYDEDIPEAVAMKNWLVNKGIDENRIFVEDKSVNTFENLKFSKRILDDMIKTDEIAVVTDGYHQYRAGFLAEEAGFKAYSINADTNSDYLPTFWVREWFGILKDYLMTNF